jgi:hypothetical protein
MKNIDELEAQRYLMVLEIKSVACFLVTVTNKKLHGVMRKNAAVLTHQLPASTVRNCAYNELVLRHTGTIHYLR